MSTTAGDLLLEAARTAMIIGAGQTPTDDETADMLRVLVELVDSWSGEEIAMFSIRTASITLASGTASYTISGARPEKILSADVVVSGINLPVEVLGPDGWAALPDKSASSSFTKAIFFDYALSSGAVLVAPVPAATATLRLYCTTALTAIADGTTVIAMPEGFLRALRYNLAVDLCSEFGRAVDPNVGRIAAESKAAIKTLNASNRAGKSTLAVPPVSA